jgi:hypothetical protein
VVVEELLTKGMTLQALRDFQDRRARQLDARAGQALECECGLMFFEREEYKQHLRSLTFEDPTSPLAVTSWKDHELRHDAEVFKQNAKW